jgi:hypothetical protein
LAKIGFFRLAFVDALEELAVWFKTNNAVQGSGQVLRPNLEMTHA